MPKYRMTVSREFTSFDFDTTLEPNTAEHEEAAMDYASNLPDIAWYEDIGTRVVSMWDWHIEDVKELPVPGQGKLAL